MKGVSQSNDVLENGKSESLMRLTEVHDQWKAFFQPTSTDLAWNKRSSSTLEIVQLDSSVWRRRIVALDSWRLQNLNRYLPWETRLNRKRGKGPRVSIFCRERIVIACSFVYKLVTFWICPEDEYIVPCGRSFSPSCSNCRCLMERVKFPFILCMIYCSNLLIYDNLTFLLAFANVFHVWMLLSYSF